MMMTPSRSLKVVFAWCFLTVGSCFTPVDFRGSLLRENGIGSIRIANLAPLSVASRPRYGTTVRLQTDSSILEEPAINERSGKLFELPNNKRRFSLRRVIQKLLRFRSRFLRSLTALVVALCISLGVGFVEAPTPAPPQAPLAARTPAQIERVYNRSAFRALGVSGGSDQTTATSSTTNNEIEAGGASAVESSKKSSSKLPTALVGTAVVAATSAGFLKSLPAKKDDKTSSPADTMDVKSNDSPTEDSTATKNSSTTDDNVDNDDEKNAIMVQKVLERAKETRPKFTTEAYLKSFENEKNMISSALNELNEQMGQSASQQQEEEETVTDEVKEVEAIVSSPPPVLEETPMVDTTETIIEKETADETEVATTTDLPLMAEEFVRARNQPKDKVEEERLKQKYAQYTNLEDKAFQILVDLGMIEVARDEAEAPTQQPETTPEEIEEEKPFQ